MLQKRKERLEKLKDGIKIVPISQWKNPPSLKITNWYSPDSRKNNEEIHHIRKQIQNWSKTF